MWHGSTQTKAMIPLFTDFRFNIGDARLLSCFIDLKVGAAWLIGNDYLRMADGFMGNGTQFYFRPAIGIRIPVSATDPDHAFNIGLTYQLITSGNNYYRYSRSLSLNNVGVAVSYEW